MGGIVEFAMFTRGYDAADFAADVNAFGAKNDIKALKRAVKNTQILGDPIRVRGPVLRRPSPGRTGST